MNSRVISLYGHIPNNISGISVPFTSMIADATRQILWKFHYESTSNIFIRLAYSDLKVDDLVTRLIDIENEKTFSSYVLENTSEVPNLNYRRYFNLVVIENCNIFRHTFKFRRRNLISLNKKIFICIYLNNILLGNTIVVVKFKKT